MMSARLILTLAAVASAQYAITDLIGKDDGSESSSSVRSQTGEWPASQYTETTETGPHHKKIKNAAPEVVAGNPMAAMLTSMAGSMEGTKAGKQPLNGALSQDSIAVVSGLVEAFMHKVKLEPGERSCLENNMGQLTGDVMGTVGDAVMAIKALIAGKGTVKKDESGNVVSAGIDSAMKLTSLVALSTQFVKNCVHGDTLVLLKKTAHHMINGTYLEHRFLVNGVDIAHSLADSIVAFESHHFHRFGTDLGVSLRKILLSKATNGTRLPEGVPDQVIIQKATDGLMRGFFVRGSGVEITDTAYPDIDIKVNLHQCIAGNSAFFKGIWMAAWDLFAQLSVNGDQHGLGKLGLGKDEQPKWSSELMVAMMQIPMALSKCGISEDMHSMLEEAIQTLGDVKVQFQFPLERFRTKGATDKMAKAVEAWTNWDFERFGFELGELCRDLIMLAFPQKYTLDTSGRLQRSFSDESAPARRISSSVILVGAAALSLLSFVIVRVVRRSRSASETEVDALLPDVEDGVDAVVE